MPVPGSEVWICRVPVRGLEPVAERVRLQLVQLLAQEPVVRQAQRLVRPMELVLVRALVSDYVLELNGARKGRA